MEQASNMNNHGTGSIKLYDTPPRTAAMLMAIVACSMKVPLNRLRFISVRKIKGEQAK